MAIPPQCFFALHHRYCATTLTGIKGAYCSSSPPYLRPAIRPTRYPAFDVPIVLSVHIPLGASFEPARLVPPVTVHGLSYCEFLLARTRSPEGACAFLRTMDIDSCIRGFVRSLDHSHHRYFIDPRHIINTIHLWTTFGYMYWHALRLTSADFTELHTPSVMLFRCMSEY